MSFFEEKPSNLSKGWCNIVKASDIYSLKEKYFVLWPTSVCMGLSFGGKGNELKIWIVLEHFSLFLTFDNLLEELVPPPPPLVVVTPETLLTLESVDMELFSFSSSLFCCFEKWQLEDEEEEEGAWLLALPLLDLLTRVCFSEHLIVSLATDISYSITFA